LQAYSAAYAISRNEIDWLALIEFKAKITADLLGIMNSWNDYTAFATGLAIYAENVTQELSH